MTRTALYRRFQNPSTGAIVAVLLVGGGLAYWYLTKDKKDKAKPLPSSVPKPGTVQLLPKIPEFMPEAPFALLVYPDNPPGAAQLEQFQQVGRTVKVPLYAVKVPPTNEYEGVLIAERKSGSWLETVSGEDDENFRDLDAAMTRVVMDWAAGTGDLPLEKAFWLGEADAVWKTGPLPPIPVDLQIGAIYTFPVNAPDPAAPVSVESSNENAAPALVFEDEGKYFVNVFPEQNKAATISVSQGDWKRKMVVNPEPFE